MARRKNAEPEKDNLERWLLTYADLITLLMIFFVVMYSMSQVDAIKFRALADSLSIALGGGTPAKIDLSDNLTGPSILDLGTAQDKGITKTEKGTDKDKDKEGNGEKDKTGTGSYDKESLTIQGVKAKLDKFAKDNGIEAKIVSTIEERGLVISMQETVLFASGSAEITPRAREILKKISVVLSTIPNYIRVEGHTDNLPINTPIFKSNWELSVLRATNVVHILTKEGNIPNTRLSAAGYGEYRPVATNETVEGREKNRRVDLIILRSKYDVTEPGADNNNN